MVKMKKKFKYMGGLEGVGRGGCWLGGVGLSKKIKNGI